MSPPSLKRKRLFLPYIQFALNQNVHQNPPSRQPPSRDFHCGRGYSLDTPLRLPATWLSELLIPWGPLRRSGDLRDSCTVAYNDMLSCAPLFLSEHLPPLSLWLWPRSRLPCCLLFIPVHGLALGPCAGCSLGFQCPALRKWRLLRVFMQTSPSQSPPVQNRSPSAPIPPFLLQFPVSLGRPPSNTVYNLLITSRVDSWSHP